MKLDLIAKLAVRKDSLGLSGLDIPQTSVAVKAGTEKGLSCEIEIDRPEHITDQYKSMYGYEHSPHSFCVALVCTSHILISHVVPDLDLTIHRSRQQQVPCLWKEFDGLYALGVSQKLLDTLFR